MKQLPLSLLLAGSMICSSAAAFGGNDSVITEKPRTNTTQRDAYQDSTMQGGSSFGWPSKVRISPPPPTPAPPPPPPATPPPVVTPPPVTPPPVDPCVLNPSDPMCGGGGIGNPFDEMFGGCTVDTIRLDQFEKGICSGTGQSNTHAIGFSVGNAINGDWAYFKEENTYRVEWTGPCAGQTSAQCFLGGMPNGQLTLKASIYRISDNQYLGTFSITSRKNVETPCRTDSACNVLE